MAELSGLALLLAVGLLAGITNAVAGGGTLFTFPVLLALGLPPVVANASNAFAVWPACITASWRYRRELRSLIPWLRPLGLRALLGAALGALLLILLDNRQFALVIPLLLGLATLLFALGPGIARWLQRQPDARWQRRARWLDWPVAVYGGFFGAGIGVMLMASLAMQGVADVQQNNALKNYVSAIVVSVAMLVFVAAGLIAWRYALVACCGAALGGWVGASWARRLPARLLRGLVLAVGALLSLHYGVEIYGPGWRALLSAG